MADYFAVLCNSNGDQRVTAQDESRRMGGIDIFYLGNRIGDIFDLPQAEMRRRQVRGMRRDDTENTCILPVLRT